MPPVDTLQLSMATITMQQQAGAGSIPLSTLIEYIIQRTYHELTVLSELLPRRTDMERKIDIVQFSSRTRQLFVRLLALVKWANSASKVDKCGEISLFLDQQAMLFVETADSLARMARETLVSARLPTFSLPCAIDVLTTGSYPRLPSCIKERIVPPDPITPAEKRETLQRLNQIIEYRLVSSELPPQLHNLSIGNGRVKFTVSHEFQVTLTLMGDGPTIPWRLLDIEFLVEDHATGDGKSLVHGLQVNYIHQLAQSRLLDNENPLHDLYNCLHTFCQSLQLEVLHTQTQRLMRERLGDHIWVEQYMVGKCLVISYWRNQGKKTDSRTDPALIYKLNVHTDDCDPGKPLQVSHTPAISGQHSFLVAKTIKSDHLELDKLLIQTIHLRSRSKLKLLLQDLKKFATGPCEVCGVPPVLSLPVLHPCMESEKLSITLDIQRGVYMVSIHQYSSCKLAEELEEVLNDEKWGSVSEMFSRIRVWLTLERCKKTVQQLPITIVKKLPLVKASGHAILNKPNNMYIKLNRQPSYYLVIEPEERKTKKVILKYHLLRTSQSTYESSDLCESMEDVPCRYVKPKYMIFLDSFSLTHGPTSRIYDETMEEIKRESKDDYTRKVVPGGPLRDSPYYIPQLSHVVASCEDRIPFIALGEELEKEDFKHQGVSVEAPGCCLALTILHIPTFRGCTQKMVESMTRSLLTCKFRAQSARPPRGWTLEMVFVNNILGSSHSLEQGVVQRVLCMYIQLTDNAGAEKVVLEFQEDVSAVCHLHSLVETFAQVFNDVSNGLSSLVEIKSFNFKKITLGYGPKNSLTVTILWKSSEKGFHVSVATDKADFGANPHHVIVNQLAIDLNQTKSLARLVQILHETWQPMSAINNLPTAPQLGHTNKVSQPICCFTIIPQSPTHVRILFRNFYCLDIYFRGNKLVAIRDGAYSQFDTSGVIDGVHPTPGLKAFLNLFLDDSSTRNLATRRRSTTEDDNPPSPVGIDTFDFMSQPQMGSPAKTQQTTKDQTGYTSSPAGGAFPLASPTSHQSTVAPSPAGMLGTPSPGMLGVNSPSNSALHVPSPGSFVPAPSPSSLGIHMPSPAGTFISPQGMVDGGSPYPTSLTMPSPGPRNWPGSPSVPGPSPRGIGSAMSPGHAALHSPPDTKHVAIVGPPSRILPQRSWAASVPTLLSHDSLKKLLTPCPLPGSQPTLDEVIMSPLERFLGCTYMKRHLQRVVQTEEKLQNVPSTEAGVVMCRSEHLECRASHNTQTLQTLHLKITKTPESKEIWAPDDLIVLEKYFELKVASAPYKPNVLTAFGRLFAAPPRILKDCINLIRFDMNLAQDRNAKWSLQLCLTMPPGGPQITPTGTPAIVLKNNKILLIFHLTRINVNLPPGTEQTVIMPLVHDIINNVSNYAEQKTAQGPPPTQASVAISTMLKRFNEMHPKGDCSLLPAVREVITNLVIPM